MISEIVMIVPIITALVAVVVGPILQWRIAKRQAADHISSKRQAWIDELRKDCASFLALVARLEGLRRPNPCSSTEDQRQTFEEKVEVSVKAYELAIRIRLRLNPKEDDHNRLKELLSGLSAACKDPNPGEIDSERETKISEFRNHVDKIMSQIQLILKKEWVRVKSGR